MIHELKVWPEFFDALANQTKNFEARKNDRGFRVRDQLLLKEYDTEKGFTGFWVQSKITYILKGGQAESVGLQPGYCVLSLEHLRKGC